MKKSLYLFLVVFVFIFFSAGVSRAEDCKKAQELSREVSIYLSYDLPLAERTLRNAVGLCNKSAALKYNLAMVLYKRGFSGAAKTKLNEALKINPNFARALNALAFIYLDEGNSSKAMALAKKAVSLDPGNTDYMDTLSKVKTPKYPPILSMEVTIEEQNGNGVIETSESAVLKVKLVNTGQGEAQIIKVTPEIEKSVLGLTMDSGITVPAIAPGNEKSLEFLIRTDEEALKTDTLSLIVNATEMNGFDADAVKISISTKAYDPPVLKIVDIGIDDQSENGQIEPAEIVEITARIQNAGLGHARGVTARVHLGKNVYFAGDTKTEFNLSNVPSGQYKDIIFSIYTSKRATDIPISVSITEERPKHNKKYPIKLVFNKREKKDLKEIVVASEAMFSSMASYTAPSLSIDIDIPPKTDIIRPDAVAVIIGNKIYDNSVVPSVEFAIRDAAVMKQYLIHTLGFKEENIMYMQNAEKTDFQKTFGDEIDHRGNLHTRTRKGRSDIFIYYSGHGTPDTNSKKPYLMPSNSDPNSIRFTGYSLDTLYQNLLKLAIDKHPKSMTVVLDACFSGTSNEGMIIQDASPIYIDIDMPLLQIDNSVVFTSSRGDQISSWYREKRHGLFTYFFLKAIKDSVKEGKDVTAGSIESALLDNDSVNDYAWKLYQRKQEPTVVGNKDIILISSSVTK